MVMNNGYVRVSKQFDVEVDYMINMFNSSIKKEMGNGIDCDYKYLGKLGEWLEEALLVKDSMIINSDGIFCVPERLANLASYYVDFYSYMN